MMKSEIIIVKLSFEKMLTNISINFAIESAVVKSILSVIFILKTYCLSFKIKKITAEILKCDFLCTKLLCWFKIIILSAINAILTFK